MHHAAQGAADNFHLLRPAAPDEQFLYQHIYWLSTYANYREQGENMYSSNDLGITSHRVGGTFSNSLCKDS